MAKRILQISSLTSVICFVSAYFFWSSSTLALSPSPFIDIGQAYAMSKGRGKTQPNSTILDKKLDLSKTKNIELDTVSIDVKLATTVSDDNHFTFMGDARNFSPEDIHFEFEGEVLKIFIDENKKNVFNLLSASESPSITLNIPNSLVSVKIKTVSGDITSENLKLVKLETISTSGDINFSSSNVDELTARSVSGDMNFNGDLKKLSQKTTSGDVKIELKNTSPDINIVTVSGDTEILFSQKPDVKLQFSSVSGELEIKLAGLEENIESSKSVQKTIGKGTGQLEIKSVSGDVLIK
jgi:DUF4097 and DUF4098 domain-containing protein YvlB